jgi:hypothetical protein
MSAIMNQGKSALNAYICPANVLRGGAPNLVPILLCALHTAHFHPYISRRSPHSPIKSALPPPPPVPLILHRTAAARLLSFFSIHHLTSLVHRSHSLPAHVVHSCTLSATRSRSPLCHRVSRALWTGHLRRRVHVVRFCHTVPTTAPVWLRLIG